MIKHLSLISVALLLAAGSAAAQAPGEPFFLSQFRPKPAPNSCPSNDKHVAEKTTACRDGQLHVCERGEWRNLGQNCTAPQAPHRT